MDKRSDVFTLDDDYEYQVGIHLYSEEIEGIKCASRAHKFNFTALLLNVSDTALHEAQISYKELESSRIINPPNIDYPLDKQELFFTFSEKYFTAIIFAITAVESFVNSLIKNDALIEFPSKKGELQNLSKFDIEQRIGLIDKIKKILPISRNVEININEMPFWNDFCELIKYRNNLVHPKSEKITVGLNRQDELLYIKSDQLGMLNEIYHASRNRDIVGSARKLISFLSEKTGYPEVTPLEFRGFKPANLMDYVRVNKVNVEYIDSEE